MKMRSDLLLRFSAVCFLLLFAGKAWAQFPQGVKSGASPQTSQALVTLAIPAVLGVNVGHNFVLDFNSATKCWGVTSSQGTFPQAPVGATTYTFAVNAASVPNTAPVACPAAGAQPDVATIQTFSTLVAASRLQVGITNGGTGGAVTLFTALMPTIFTGNLLSLSSPDACAGVKAFPASLQVAAANELTAIPASGWTNCRQTLTLTLQPLTGVAAGTATGTITYTMVSP